ALLSRRYHCAAGSPRPSAATEQPTRTGLSAGDGDLAAGDGSREKYAFRSGLAAAIRTGTAAVAGAVLSVNRLALNLLAWAPPRTPRCSGDEAFQKRQLLADNTAEHRFEVGFEMVGVHGIQRQVRIVHTADFIRHKGRHGVTGGAQ